MRKILFIRLQNFRGVSLVELMIGLGLTSGLVLMDLQRQKNNQIVTRSQLATESVSGLRNSLRNWLRQGGTIENSFGWRVMAEDAPLNKVRIIAGTPTNFARESNDAVIDTNAITGIRLQGGVNILIQREVDGVRLIGPVDGTGIRSLDNSGWVYIRTMWIQDFQQYSERNTIIDDGGRDRMARLRRGTANLKVLIWRFTNMMENPGLNCVANNNCEREVITLPLDLRTFVNGDAAFGSTPGRGEIFDGTFGLQCGPTNSISTGDAFNCEGNQFFDVTEELCKVPIAAGSNERRPCAEDGSEPMSIGERLGRCCRFVQ